MTMRTARPRTSGDLIASIAGRVPMRNLHSQVLWQLGVAIVGGDFPEGSILPSDVLAWHFETGPDEAFLRSLAEIRIGVELESAALAALRRTDEQAQALIDCARAMGETTTPEDFARTDLEFHRTIAQASANPFMASISTLVELALTAAFTISSPIKDPTAMAATVKAHTRIAQAIQAGDPEEARVAMKAVISEGLDRQMKARG